MGNILAKSYSNKLGDNSMVMKRKDLPDVGELVVGTIIKVFDYGAYVTLDEYGGLEAYLPWSEVSSRWIRNIKDYLREGQKVVGKVIRVNKAKKHVDISLKRVTEGERRRKILEWKRAVKADKILELAAEKLGKTKEEAYKEAGWKLEDYYGEIYAGLEETVLKGIEALLEAGVPEEWAKVLKELADKHITIKKVKVKGILTLQILKPNGVEIIKEALTKALSNIPQNVEARIYTIGAPRYVVEVTATDYKLAEKTLSRIVKTATNIVKEQGGTASFERVRT